MTQMDTARPRRHDTNSDLGKRVVVTAIALTLAFATTYIAAPGINHEVIGGSDGALAKDAGMLARLSITSLWFTPVLGALLLTETLKLFISSGSVLPDKKRLMHCTRLNRFTLVVALSLAAFQAYGVAAALDGMQATGGLPIVLDPGIWFRVSFVATQVAGVAVLIALADHITRHGIGSGFWVIIAAGQLSGLGSALATLLTSFLTGHIPGVALLAVAVVSLATIAATVAFHRAYVKPAGDAGHYTLPPKALLIPPLLGAALAQVVYGLGPMLSFLAGEQVSPQTSYAPDDPMLLMLTGGMIVLIAHLASESSYTVRAPAAATSGHLWVAAGAAAAILTIALDLASATAGVAPPLPVPILIAIALIVLEANQYLAGQRAPAAH